MIFFPSLSFHRLCKMFIHFSVDLVNMYLYVLCCAENSTRYMYQDSKLLAPLVCFAELVAGWAGQHAMYN